jgi:hypothetical protein
MFLISLRYFAFHPALENLGINNYFAQITNFNTLGAGAARKWRELQHVLWREWPV